MTESLSGPTVDGDVEEASPISFLPLSAASLASLVPNTMSIRNLFLIALFACTANSVLAAGNTPPEIARYLKKQGPVIERRIFQSGADQIVVSFCVDENREGGANEGASNPANVHCEVALFNRKGKWVFANQVSIGQGFISEFANGKVRGESVTYAPEDPLCCPSKRKPLAFSTEGERLVVDPL